MRLIAFTPRCFIASLSPRPIDIFHSVRFRLSVIGGLPLAASASTAVEWYFPSACLSQRAHERYHPNKVNPNLPAPTAFLVGPVNQLTLEGATMGPYHHTQPSLMMIHHLPTLLPWKVSSTTIQYSARVVAPQTRHSWLWSTDRSMAIACRGERVSSMEKSLPIGNQMSQPGPRFTNSPSSPWK